MVGYIYLITDTTNGMKYTGKHHYHIEGQLDPNYHGSGTIIKNIYKKRPETLKEEYIKTCYSEEEMCSDEQYYIKVFKTLWPNGYNLTEGGDGVMPCEETRRKMSENHYDCSGEKNPMFGKKLSEEVKKKMSLSKKGKPLTEKQLEKRKGLFVGEKNPMYGKKHTEETRKKISAKHKGKPSPNKGKHLSEETKKKISAANKGKPKWSDEARRKMSITRKGKTNGKKSKKVLQFTLDDEFVREWPSTAECGRNGFNSGYISACCLGKHKSAYGFKWCYAEE